MNNGKQIVPTLREVLEVLERAVELYPELSKTMECKDNETDN